MTATALQSVKSVTVTCSLCNTNDYNSLTRCFNFCPFLEVYKSLRPSWQRWRRDAEQTKIRPTNEREFTTSTENVSTDKNLYSSLKKLLLQSSYYLPWYTLSAAPASRRFRQHQCQMSPFCVQRWPWYVSAVRSPHCSASPGRSLQLMDASYSDERPDAGATKLHQSCIRQNEQFHLHYFKRKALAGLNESTMVCSSKKKQLKPWSFSRTASGILLGS